MKNNTLSIEQQKAYIHSPVNKLPKGVTPEEYVTKGMQSKSSI